MPPPSNGNQQREPDHHWYKEHNLVERFFNRIKQFRRLATLHEKRDRKTSGPGSTWRVPLSG